MAKATQAQGLAPGTSVPGLNPKHASAGFTEAIPGMSAAPRARELARKTQRELDAAGKGFADVHKEYHELSRMMRIVNRAMKGPLKGQPFMGCADSLQWPDDVDSDDERTWLQPGEYMDVPKDVAFVMFGNLWDPSRPDRQDIIRKYGNHPFEPPKDEKVAGQAPMIPTGCPPIPDLVVYEVNARGQRAGEFKFVYDVYCRDYGKFYEKDLTDLTDAREASLEELNDGADGRLRVDPRAGEVKEQIVPAS